MDTVRQKIKIFSACGADAEVDLEKKVNAWLSEKFRVIEKVIQSETYGQIRFLTMTFFYIN